MTQDSVLFWTAFGAVGQAIGAIATAAAVIVALWVTLSERAVKVTVSAGLRLIIAGDGSPAIDVICIKITNAGLRSVRVNSVGWRTGWLPFGPSWLKQQFAVQKGSSIPYSADPPFDLGPGQEQSITLDTEPFSRAQSENLRLTFFSRKRPFHHSPLPTRVEVVAYMVAAKPVYARAERALEKFLSKGEIASDQGASHFNARTAEIRSDVTKTR